MINIIEIKDNLLDEIVLLENKAEHLRKIVDMLSSDLLGADMSRMPTLLKKRLGNRDLIPTQYPKTGPEAKKIRYILSSYKRAMTEEEIKQIIKEFEGDRARILNKVRMALNNLFQRKKIVKFNYRGSAVTFYMDYDGLDSIGKVNKSYQPIPELVADIPSAEIIEERITIYRQK